MNNPESPPPFLNSSQEQDRSVEGYLDARIEKAVMDCEIEPTSEVQEAITGYYIDQYGLAAMIDGSLEGAVTDEQLDGVLAQVDGAVPSAHFERALEGYEYASFDDIPSAETATRLLAFAVKKERTASSDEEKARAHDVMLRCASRALYSVLFQERSLGITTIGEPELKTIRDLYAKLFVALQGSTAKIHEGTIRWPVNNGGGEFVIEPSYTEAKIKDSQEKFWADCRQAGQLEFHNTGNLGEVSSDGRLMPRTEQMRRKGAMRAQTATWDEMHSVVPHFSERYDPNGYKITSKQQTNEKATGTVAIALADIIRMAPYARDARYAVVRPRNTDLAARIPLPSNEGIVHIGNGHPDLIGANGGDRVFFSSDREVEGQTQPDEYAIPLDSGATLVLSGEEVATSQTFGLGESMPSRIHITETDDPSESIRQLQDEYLARPQYAGQIVVPLRRGVFRFAAEGMDIRDRAGRAAPQYNRRPKLGQAAA